MTNESTEQGVREAVLACPFCGNEPVVQFDCELGRWDIYEVECTTCCFTRTSLTGFEGEKAKQSAINVWNTRLATLSPDDIRREDLITGEEAWDELVNVDDRTSPEEYPDMCLITRDELIEFMSRSIRSQPSREGEK